MHCVIFLCLIEAITFVNTTELPLRRAVSIFVRFRFLVLGTCSRMAANILTRNETLSNPGKQYFAFEVAHCSGMGKIIAYKYPLAKNVGHTKPSFRRISWLCVLANRLFCKLLGKKTQKRFRTSSEAKTFQVFCFFCVQRQEVSKQGKFPRLAHRTINHRYGTSWKLQLISSFFKSLMFHAGQKSHLKFCAWKQELENIFPNTTNFCSFAQTLNPFQFFSEDASGRKFSVALAFTHCEISTGFLLHVESK
jgi:hypothetical protein